MKEPNWDDYYVLCSNRGLTSQLGPYKTKEEAEQVAESQRARTETGKLIRPMFGPLSELRDEELTCTFPVYQNVKVDCLGNLYFR